MPAGVNNEQGVIVIIGAALLVVVAAFLALGIDLTRVASAQRKQHETAQLAALGALAAYQAAVPTAATEAGRYRERLAAAIDRAEQILGFQENGLRIGVEGAQLDPAANELREGSGALADRSGGQAGVFTPGVWYFEQPAGGCGSFGDKSSSCPCPGGAWQGECFHRNTASDTALTSVEIALNTKTTSPVAFAFAHVLPGSSRGTQVTSRGRASMKPRLFPIGVDRSRSVTFETHIPWDRLTDTTSNRAKSSEYVFPLGGGAGSRCASGYDNPCLNDVANPFILTQGCQFQDNAFFHVVWYSMPKTRDDSRLYPKTKHFRDDYTCWTVNGRSYLIDTSVHDFDDGGDGTADGRYVGPEPLVLILRVLRQALLEIQAKSVPGDRVAIFAFDQDAPLNSPSFIGPTNPFDTATWQELLDVTNVDTAADMPGHVPGATPPPLLFKRLKGHEFFPQPPASYTDIAGALLSAVQSIEVFSYLKHANVQITLFTDGLANVRHPDALTIYDESTNTYKLGDEDAVVCGPNDRLVSPFYNCWKVHDEAAHEAVNLVAGDDQRFWGPQWDWYSWKNNQDSWTPLAKRGYKVNMVPFSKQIQPHTLLKQSIGDPTKCMDDADARKNWRGLTYDSDIYAWTHGVFTCYATLDSGSACPYTSIANVYYLGAVKASGGLFQMIRPPCNPSAITARFPSWNITQGSCQSGELQRKLDSQVCALYNGARSYGEWSGYGGNSNAWEFTVGADSDLRPVLQQLQDAGVVDMAQWQLDTDQFPPPLVNKDWEGRWFGTRVVCDQRCRSPEMQLQEMFENMFNQNPFVRVRDDIG